MVSSNKLGTEIYYKYENSEHYNYNKTLNVTFVMFCSRNKMKIMNIMEIK